MGAAARPWPHQIFTKKDACILIFVLFTGSLVVVVVVEIEWSKSSSQNRAVNMT